MAKKNYYAVKIGKTPGIYNSWDECKTLVDGYPGATYKGFATREEAEIYLGIDIKKVDKIETEFESEAEEEKECNCIPEGVAVAYVDGSYNKDKKLYGYGIVFRSDREEKEISKTGNDPIMLKMWNVAGEVSAAMDAIDYAIKVGYSKLTIYHDYTGIAGWANGWKANEDGAKRYKHFVTEAKKKIELDFIKVKSHSGDRYNDRADALAKQGCGI